MTESHPQDIALFLSSTFRDMQAEREVLVKEAFPRLQQTCLERGARLHVVDLRWGIPPDRSASDEVIETCLREVERCRPLFVALLGQRYGWVPEHLGEGLIARHPWLSGYPDRSLTELEIRHGALDFDEHAVRAHFYLRDPRFLDTVAAAERDIYVDGDAQSARKLDALLREIRGSEYPTFDYLDPGELATKLVEDLTDELQTMIGPAPVQRERRRVIHQEIMGDAEGTRRVQSARLEYMRARNRVAAGAIDPLFIDRRGRVDVIRDFLSDGASVLACVGSEGSGTSHLLAHAARVLGEGPNAPLILPCHATELGEGSVIPYLYWELCERTGQDAWRGLEAKPADLQAALRSAARRRPVLLTIDDASASLLSRLEWTRDGLPAQCKLAIAARPEALPDPLPGSWCRHDLLPPSPEEVRDYLRSYFARYGKALSERQLERLVEEGSFHTFARLFRVAEELRVFGRFEELDQTIAALLDARSDLEFYGTVFDRLGADLGREARGFVELMQALVTVRRERLTDEEAVALLDMPPLDWVRLRTRLAGLFEAHQPYEVGLPPDIAEAARRHFIATENERRSVHARLANRYSPAAPSVTQRADALRIASRAYHLDQAGLTEDLEALLGEVRAIETLDTSFDDYWARLPSDAQKRLLTTYEGLVRACLQRPDPELAAGMVGLASFYARRGLEDGRRKALSGAIVAVLSDPGRTADDARRQFMIWPLQAGGRGDALALLHALVDRSVPVPVNKLHHVTAKLEELDAGADIALKTAAAGLKSGLEQVDAEGFVELTRYASWLAFQANHGGEGLASLLSRALERSEFQEPANLEARIDLLHQLAWIHAYGERFQQALDCFDRMELTLEERAPTLKWAQLDAGRANVLSQLGRHSEAIELGRRALENRLETPPPLEHLHEFALALAVIVGAAVERDPDVLEVLERSLERPELGNEEVAAERARIQINLGFAYWQGGDFPNAFGQFRAVLDSIDPDTHPLLVGQAHAGLGYIQYTLGNDSEAVGSLNQAIEQLESADDDVARISAAVARVRMARSLGRMGRHEDALQMIESALSSMQPPERYATERASAFEIMAEIHELAGEADRARIARLRARSPG